MTLGMSSCHLKWLNGSEKDTSKWKRTSGQVSSVASDSSTTTAHTQGQPPAKKRQVPLECELVKPPQDTTGHRHCVYTPTGNFEKFSIAISHTIHMGEIFKILVQILAKGVQMCLLDQNTPLQMGINVHARLDLYTYCSLPQETLKNYL